MTLPTDDLLLRALADRAGVDHHKVRLVERRRLRTARCKQPAGHLLRVAPVHLAAERPDVERRQGPRFRAIFGQARIGRLHRLVRWLRARHLVEHRQLARGHRAIASRTASMTDGGTLSVALASAYLIRAP